MVSLWGAVELEPSQNMQRVQIVNMPNLGYDVECTLTSVRLPTSTNNLSDSDDSDADSSFSWASFCDIIPADQKLILRYPGHDAFRPVAAVICTQRAVLSDIPERYIS